MTWQGGCEVKEVRQLRRKAVDSLVLSIEHFNRPWDRGKSEAVLILLDHGFEMLLKAAIRHRQGKIRKPGEKQTIGWCVCPQGAHRSQREFPERRAGADAGRSTGNATQHYLIDMSEHQLYFYAHAGVTSSSLCTFFLYSLLLRARGSDAVPRYPRKRGNSTHTNEAGEHRVDILTRRRGPPPRAPRPAPTCAATCADMRRGHGVAREIGQRRAPQPRPVPDARFALPPRGHRFPVSSRMAAPNTASRHG